MSYLKELTLPIRLKEESKFACEYSTLDRLQKTIRAQKGDWQIEEKDETLKKFRRVPSVDR